MDNVITITLKDVKGQDPIFKIDFENNPGLNELLISKLLLEEILEHNFKKQDILLRQGIVYPRIRDIEEIKRGIRD